MESRLSERSISRVVISASLIREGSRASPPGSILTPPFFDVRTRKDSPTVRSPRSLASSISCSWNALHTFPGQIPFTFTP